MRALEKAKSSGQFTTDGNTALLTSSDAILSPSPNSDNMMDGHTESTLDTLHIKVENNNSETSSEEEYGTKTKRRKRDV